MAMLPTRRRGHGVVVPCEKKGVYRGDFTSKGVK